MAILKDYWPAVLALAAELDKRGTIDGAGIDRIIEEAEFEVVRAAELSRRAKWAEIAERAALFEKNVQYRRPLLENSLYLACLEPPKFLETEDGRNQPDIASNIAWRQGDCRIPWRSSARHP